MHDKPLGETLGWKLIQSASLFRSRWFNLRQDTISVRGQRETTYTYIEHPGSVFVVPVTADGQILLIHSYRYTLDAWCWEVPAGTMGDAVGLSPESAAIRELREEAGATCRTLTHLGEFYLANGFANHRTRFFLAWDVRVVSRPDTEPLEQIAKVTSFPLTEVERLIREGEIKDGDSAFALLLAMNYLNTNKSPRFTPQADPGQHHIKDNHE
jgi:ADP-ribose pyrophosphatase